MIRVITGLEYVYEQAIAMREVGHVMYWSRDDCDIWPVQVRRLTASSLMDSERWSLGSGVGMIELSEVLLAQLALPGSGTDNSNAYRVSPIP